MAAASPKLAQDLIDAWNTHDPEHILALFTEDLVYEDVTFAAFPDLRFELTSAVVAGDRGAAEWTMTGTHRGDFPGLPATGKSFTVRGASIFDLAGDKLRHNRDYWDFATLLRQLGLMAEPASA